MEVNPKLSKLIMTWAQRRTQGLRMGLPIGLVSAGRNIHLLMLELLVRVATKSHRESKQHFKIISNYFCFVSKLVNKFLY